MPEPTFRPGPVESDRFPPGLVRKLVADLSEAAGVASEDARLFAEALVEADVRGASTHGVSRLDIYLRRIQRGLIDPRAELVVEQRSEAVLVVDAGGGLGQVQATKVLDRLFPIAGHLGVAAATVRNSQHFGALAFYCSRAANRNMILLAMTNCEPAMPPHGANEPFFGTNPIAVGFPTGRGYPITVDLATSVVARGNIIVAARRGESIPSGWALDSEGEPTTDAHAALLGAVLTMAGHKGSALALMVEALAGVLSGSAVGREVGSMYKDMDRAQNVGHFFCLLDISAFMDLSVWSERIDGMITVIQSLRRSGDAEEILLPGERSHRRSIENTARGIRLDPKTLAELDTLCSEYNIESISARMTLAAAGRGAEDSKGGSP